MIRGYNTRISNAMRRAMTGTLGNSFSSSSHWVRRLVKDEDGSELVEFACASSILFACLFGIMGICNACAAYHFTSYSAREATRYAMVRGATWKGTSCASVTTTNCMATAANVTSFVQSAVPIGLKVSNLTVTTTWSGAALSGGSMACVTTNGTNSPGCVVRVNVKYNFTYGFPYLPSAALDLQASSSVVVLR
jgi:Flp pilus assembly protein TadG